MTPYGEASVAWRKSPEGIEADVLVPVGTEADVGLPGHAHRVLASGRYHLALP
jgi:alpha-L-rhamnosidase